ncbi:tRNA (5-methylaminomethyl-2-thiouridine)(34)-methyltransferase MnmD [Pedobacter sp. ASV28]|uniref:tRNA (5-methylaminomethyl-2-thiouridine)(34)-methyltransferase MnmD n=1 Tax=Pedobacter sp. ASV28 TaxID=2795123 RepID=UPI0018EE2222|nr:tRNA (5-methylaminomethyl-2-thiouridine)(34)-methyltransferase MnmD [Pedobacter sp. ASV28]
MNILIKTADGSNTLFNDQIGEHYHSAHGALQESRHVFIEAGLKHSLITNQDKEELNVLEIGFGTGLNFLLSFAHCHEIKTRLNYKAIEAFPLSSEILESTAYSEYVSPYIWQSFINGYEKAIHATQQLSEYCCLEIFHGTFQQFNTDQKFDVLYYDAFSVRHQPELWTNEIIAHACNFLNKGGIFVTYAITGNLKRAIKSCGFEIEKLQGAPGKREMLRAKKIV